MDNTILSVNNLKKYFYLKGKGKLHAVDDISFDILQGETLGLVGESGCGKSTVANVLIRLLPATGGSVKFEGRNILVEKGKQKKITCKEIQIIFQDPYSSLNPKKTVGKILSEPFRVQKTARGNQIKLEIDKLCEITSLSNDILSKYPYELDGGKRQTIGIARSLALNPKLIICDEPVSALDVSIQAQIINLMMELQKKLKLTYLFISHDLSVVKHISNKIMVMYLGKIMEAAETEELFSNAMHPYSIALLSAVPSIEKVKSKNKVILEGDVPSPVNPKPGCRFCNRCWKEQEICSLVEPKLRDIVGNGHKVACHFPENTR